MKSPFLSVIICAHNPRLDYLTRVLAALNAQSLAQDCWELLLIDNASDRPLAEEIDLSWHFQARLIEEPQLGLTAARLRGIREAKAEVLVFVDDDNVLAPDFLEVTCRISKKWAILGAWGGQIRPEFESTPSEWSKPYWGYLAVREFDRDQWSNLLHQTKTTPYGAGLCSRKPVAERYAELVKQDPRRRSLGRKGNILTACEDTDLAFTACEMGFGTGIFTELKLTHLIPDTRLEEDYLLRLVKGMAYSGAVLAALRGNFPIIPSRSQQIFQLYTRWRLDPRKRRFQDAVLEGQTLARREIESWNSF